MLECQIGERIKQLRIERNLSRAELGTLVGVTARCIGSMERGSNKITAATIVRLCEKTGVSADYVLFGTRNHLTAFSNLYGFTREQAQLTLDIVMRAIEFLKTSTANYALIQEVLRQQDS
jgi:transcriptional regulator with XRE-family HTH domain